MKMRDYVDGIQGVGSWDQMHDLINAHQIVGWDLPPIEVDGIIVNIFPGSNREVTLEQVKAEMRKAFKEAADLKLGKRMDADEELQFFRMLHRWHEEIDDKYRDIKLRVEEIKRELIDFREKLRELRKQ